MWAEKNRTLGSCVLSNVGYPAYLVCGQIRDEIPGVGGRLDLLEIMLEGFGHVGSGGRGEEQLDSLHVRTARSNVYSPGRRGTGTTWCIENEDKDKPIERDEKENTTCTSHHHIALHLFCLFRRRCLDGYSSCFLFLLPLLFLLLLLPLLPLLHHHRHRRRRR